MSNKKTTGDIFRFIIDTIASNLASLEMQRVKYGKFKRFIKGIDRNIAHCKKQLTYYQDLLADYKKAEWVE